jgi:hypothetical protein
MFAKQYSHHLPADCDMAQIDRRLAARAPLWDGREGLAFKAFVSRRRGRNGAAANVYSSVYLWLDDAAAAGFLLDGFQHVIDGFGRPRVEAWLPLAARRGPAEQALSLVREDRVIGEGTDLPALQAAEVDRIRGLAGESDVVAAVVALDVQAWTLVRLTLSSRAADGSRPGTAFDVLHLSRPGLERLS